MSYGECKVYFDGSHYIAIPHTTRPSRRRFRPPEEEIEVTEQEEPQTTEQEEQKKAHRLKMTMRLLRLQRTKRNGNRPLNKNRKRGR